MCVGLESGQIGSVVHLENAYASGLKKRPRGPRSILDAAQLSQLEPIPRMLSADLRTLAMNYYLHYHVQTQRDIPDITKGIANDVLSLWAIRTEKSTTDLAVSSYALAVFSRTQNSASAATEAASNYDLLLKVLRKRVQSVDTEMVNDCLLAIFYMSRYEEAVHQPEYFMLHMPITSISRSFAHHDGALAILKIWEGTLSRCIPATDIIRYSRRGLIRSALMRNMTVPEWMQDGTVFGEKGLELDYDRIIVRIVMLRWQITTLLENKTSLVAHPSRNRESVAEDLNKEALDIDHALQQWAARFPSTWNWQRHSLPEPHPWPLRDFFSPIVHSYSNLAYAAVWNQYHATRVLINSIRLRILSLCSTQAATFAPRNRLECLSNIEAAGNDIASSVPFCLHKLKVPETLKWGNVVTLSTNEEVKPYLATMLVWPLTICSSLREVNDRQRTWFRSELAHLGKALGIRVLERAESDQWLEL